MIVTATLNPMLDKTVDVETLVRGRIQRAGRVEMVVGGKGVNVSRQLRRLGVETVATGLVGGHVGVLLRRLLTAEGIAHDFVEIASNTREGVTYREPDGTWTSVFEPPHTVTADEAEMFVAKCLTLLPGCRWLVCSGSSPCPAADGLYARVIRAAGERGVAAALDSYGDTFLQGLGARPAMIKINTDELRHMFGGSVTNDGDVLRALGTLSGRGARYVIITDGPGPVFASERSECWKLHPPRISAVNPTGSGDAMIAAVLATLEQGEPFERALVRGVAAGAANARVWEVANSKPGEIRSLEALVRIEQLRT
jgi:1-phosphofructokinase family hexose kinase